MSHTLCIHKHALNYGCGPSTNHQQQNGKTKKSLSKQYQLFVFQVYKGHLLIHLSHGIVRLMCVLFILVFPEVVCVTYI